jgi:hypothetical protein
LLWAYFGHFAVHVPKSIEMMVLIDALPTASITPMQVCGV